MGWHFQMINDVPRGEQYATRRVETWYPGHRLADYASLPDRIASQRWQATQRLKVRSYNVGGDDVVVVQELHHGCGKTDHGWQIPGWSVTITADAKNRYSGVGVFISKRIASEDRISCRTWLQGRLLHVRCFTSRVTIDVVAGYQWVWQGRDNETVIANRSLFWGKLSALLQTLPTRNLVVVAMDANTQLQPLPGLIGRGVLRTTQHRDLEFEALLQAQNLVVLNSWGSSTRQACHTFANGTTYSQIDVVALRRPMADVTARRAAPESLDLAPWRIRGAQGELLSPAAEFSAIFEYYQNAFSAPLDGTASVWKLCADAFADLLAAQLNMAARSTRPFPEEVPRTSLAQSLRNAGAPEAIITAVMRRLEVESPLTVLTQTLTKRVSKLADESVCQWFMQVQANLNTHLQTTATACSIVALDADIELGVACPECGLYFPNHRSRMTEMEEAAQSLQARQDLMEIWGGRASRKNDLPEEETNPEAEDVDRKSKYRRDDQKGKGHSTDSWSGWQRQGKRNWQQQNQQAEATTAALDAPTQELIKCMVKMNIRHEQELMRLRPDMGFVLFCDTSEMGCLQMLRTVSLGWQEKFANGTVSTSLKSLMVLALVKDLKERVEAVLAKEDQLLKCQEMGWMVQTETALNPSWVYFGWDSTAKKQIVLPDPPLKHAECLRQIDLLLEHLPREGVLARFSTPKELLEKYETEVIPFNLTLSLRGASSDLCHEALKKLSGCAAMKLQGVRLRPERIQKPPLAKALEAAYLAAPFCEFLQHFLAVAQSAAYQGRWEARLGEAGGPFDSGTLGHAILLPIAGVALPTLQMLLDSWHRQHALHAIAQHKGVIWLQLERYAHNAHKCTTTLRVRPGDRVAVPLFSEAAGLEVRHETFTVVVLVYHIGDSVCSGHYRSLIGVPQDDQWGFYICDDGKVPRQARPKQEGRAQEAAILQALWGLLPLGTFLKPAVTLATRNELVYLAQTSLTTDAFEQLLQLLDKIAVEDDSCAIVSYPEPCYVNACESTSAEKTADRHLREGSGSLWVAVRETVRELDFQPDARSFACGRYAKFGLYSKGGLVGMAKWTSQHVSACRLLNAAVLSVRPEHRWTSITIGMDNETLPHTDQGNATTLSLLVGLTHHHRGELWLESMDGTQYMDTDRGLIRGRAFPTSMQAVLFDA
ncbi:unnamed protein product, partial [Symbiodinium necroappetens]